LSGGLSSRKNPLVGERRPQTALPCHRLLLEQRREQIELFLEQRLVLRQIEAEQRKRLGERAASQCDLGTPVRGGIDRGETLEHANGIVGREHRHRRAEQDPRGAPGDGREHHFGCRDGEIRTMVLADAEGIDAEPVGQHRLLDHLADDLGVAVKAAIGAGGDIAECIEPEFHCCAATRMFVQEIRFGAGAFNAAPPSHRT
jgi:hypothetical protein